MKKLNVLLLARLLGCSPVVDPYKVEDGDLVVECSDLFDARLPERIGIVMSLVVSNGVRIARVKSLLDGKVRKFGNPYMKVVVRKRFVSLALGETEWPQK